VDPVPDPLLVRKSVSAGNRTRTSGSVARQSDHYTTEAVVLKSLYSVFAAGIPSSEEVTAKATRELTELWKTVFRSASKTFMNVGRNA
jgi:hypothetical protein